MWIFCKQGMFSVTQHPKRKDNIQVRACTETDLLELKVAFPELDRCPIVETTAGHYRWRLIVARWKWELVGAKLVADIDYSNFKGKVEMLPSQRNKGGFLRDIFALIQAYQRARHPEDPLADHPRLFREAGDPLLPVDSDKPETAVPQVSLGLRMQR